MAFRTYADQVLLEGDNTKTFEAAEPIQQGQLVKLDTDSAGRTVEPADADGEQTIGFAIYSVAAGEQVAVAMDGCVVRATSATGTVASGNFVTSGGGGTGEEGEVMAATQTTVSDGTAAGTKGDYVIGFAVEDDAGAHDDAIVYVNTGGLV